MFLITTETGVAAGIRRIEALVGQRAWEQVNHIRSILLEASSLTGTEPAKVVKRIEELKQSLVADSKARERMAQHFVQILAERVLSDVTTINDTDFAVAKVEALGRDELRLLADVLKSRRERIVGLLAAPDNKRLAVLSFSAKSASKEYPAGEILKAVAKKLKGGGGGSPTLAEGSIAETSLEELAAAFLEVVKKTREEK
jgi:alanyl-tRNA synthetase